MPETAKHSGSPDIASGPTDDQVEPFEGPASALLSVIAGMVDLIGFFTLGNIFTAHVTGNLVLAAVAVHGGRLNVAQALAIPAFTVAVAATWVIALVSNGYGPVLARLQLRVPSVLLSAVLLFCASPDLRRIHSA